jgi:Big-like domain-containing protein
VAVQETNYLQDGTRAGYIRALDENGDPTGNFLELRGINAADLQRVVTERIVPAKNTRLRKDSKLEAYEGTVSLACLRADMLEYFLPGETSISGNKVTFTEKVNQQPKRFALYIESDAVGVNDEPGAIGEFYPQCTATNFNNAKTSAEYVTFEVTVSAEPKDGTDARQFVFDEDGLPFNVSGDDTAPTVSTATPANSATDVAIDANLVLVFSQDMNENSLKNIKMWDPDTGTPVVLALDSYVSGTKTATFTHADFTNNNEYEYMVPDTVRNAAGVYKAADEFYRFTTVA